MKIDNRVEIPANKECYITIKDHKPGFPHDIKCRLINPCKSNIGKITKQILDKTNCHIKTVLDLELLENTASAIKWFENIKDKTKKQLIQIDIVDYYPSIDEQLFQKAINFAEKTTQLSELEKELLHNARLSLLYNNGTPWTKNSGLFDVTMGSYDGAQITDLVGLLILKTLDEKVPEISFALYRDDGIGVHKKLSPKKLEEIKKKLHKAFKELGLKITVETGLHKMDFLDVTLDIMSNSYAPYRKPNDTPQYVHVESNHPAHVLKNIPLAVNKRLKQISKTKTIFDNSSSAYQDALNKSGYKHTLKYDDSTNPTANPSPNHSTPATRSKPASSTQHVPTATAITGPTTAAHSTDNSDPNTQTALPDPATTAINETAAHLPTATANHAAPLNRALSPALNTPPNTGPRRSQRLRNKTTHNNNKASVTHIPPATTNVCVSTPLTPSAPLHTSPSDPPANCHNPQDKPKNKRQRSILWYTPPFNKNLTTKFGQAFLKLITKHFPKNHPLHPVMNRQKVKISYSTTPNMQQIITAHNRKLLNKNKAHVNNTEPCKCRQLPCPIPDKCNARSVIYKAEVAGISYIGLTANAIKQRICGHRQSFREEAKKNASTLATFVWDNNLNKDDNGNAAEPKITWSILKNCHVYTAGQKACDLCLSEKLFLIKAAGDPKNINKRNDIANRCVHKQKQYYSAVT